MNTTERPSLTALVAEADAAVRAGEAAAAQAGAQATRHDSGLGLPGQFEHANDLLSGLRKDNAARHLLVSSGPVKGVGNQVFLFGEDIIGAQKAAQVGEDARPK